MQIFQFLYDYFGFFLVFAILLFAAFFPPRHSQPFTSEFMTNPATGLPMVDEFVDCDGNPYGTRKHF